MRTGPNSSPSRAIAHSITPPTTSAIASTTAGERSRALHQRCTLRAPRNGLLLSAAREDGGRRAARAVAPHRRAHPHLVPRIHLHTVRRRGSHVGVHGHGAAASGYGPLAVGARGRQEACAHRCKPSAQPMKQINCKIVCEDPEAADLLGERYRHQAWECG